VDVHKPSLDKIVFLSEADENIETSNLKPRDKEALGPSGLNVAYIKDNEFLGKRTEFPDFERSDGYIKLKYKPHMSAAKNLTLSAMADLLKAKDEKQKGGLISALLGRDFGGKKKPEEFYAVDKQILESGEFVFRFYNQYYIKEFFNTGDTMVSQYPKYYRVLQEAKAKHGAEEFWLLGVSKDIADYPKFVDSKEPLEPKPFTQDFLAFKHLTIAGMNGSGKSVTAVGLLVSIKISHPETIFYYIDAKGSTDWDALAEYTSPNPLAKSGAENFKTQMITNINAAYNEFQNRKKLFSKPDVMAANISVYRKNTGIRLPRIILVFEEISAALGDEYLNFNENWNVAGTAANKIYQIAIQGRSFGVHLVLISQRLVDTAIPLKLSAQTTKIIHKVEAADAMSMHINAPEATGLPIGMFLVRDDDTRKIGSAPFIGADIDKSVRELFAKAGIPSMAKNPENPYVLDSYVKEESDLAKDIPHFLKLYTSAVFRHVFGDNGIKTSIPTSKFSNSAIISRNPIYSLEKENKKVSIIAFGKKGDSSKLSASDWIDIFDRCNDKVIIMAPEQLGVDETMLIGATKSEKEIYLFCGSGASTLGMRIQSEETYAEETYDYIWSKMTSEMNLIAKDGCVQSPSNNPSITKVDPKKFRIIGAEEETVNSPEPATAGKQSQPSKPSPTGRPSLPDRTSRHTQTTAPAEVTVPTTPASATAKAAEEANNSPSLSKEVEEVKEPAKEVIEKKEKPKAEKKDPPKDVKYEEGFCAYCRYEGKDTEVRTGAISCSDHTSARRRSMERFKNAEISIEGLTTAQLGQMAAEIYFTKSVSQAFVAKQENTAKEEPKQE
jgi:hypothetical protein